MNYRKARDYFEDALENNTLFSGENIMVDAEEKIWKCHVWARGGIAWIKEVSRDNTIEVIYHAERYRAMVYKSTVFEVR